MLSANELDEENQRQIQNEEEEEIGSYKQRRIALGKDRNKTELVLGKDRKTVSSF